MAQELNASAQIDNIVASQANWKGALLAELRAVILSASRELYEDVKWKMPSKPLGSPTWEFNGIVCVADYLKSAVRITFPKGAKIEDPDGLFNSRLDSKTVRAIDFFEGEKLQKMALKRLVKNGIAVNNS